MKKYLFFTGIVASVFAISSCNKVNDVPDSVIEVPDGMYLFTLEASSMPETKTYYTGDGGSIASDKVFNWSAGDQISVLFHKGSENEFFTLTNQSGDCTSATFKGLILDGYTIGASDTETKWALFPASDGHSYTPGVADPATDPVVMFNIPAETDFSASHFSANIPMAAKGDGSNHFVFDHLASAYKFTFTGLDVSKVRLTVENQESYFLSGNNPLNAAGSAIAYNYAFSRNANHSISFVENVVGKKATFYVPFKTWEGQFTPILTLYDAETGYTIKTLTATSAFSGDLGTKYNRVIIVPDISAPGTGSPFVSAYGRNWGSVSAVADGSTADGKDAIIQIKADADASYLYLYFAVNAARMHSDASYKYSNHWDWYFGDAESSSSTVWTDKRTIHVEGWIKKRNVITLSEWNDNMESNFSQLGDVIYVEQKVKRSAYACLQGTSCKVGLLITAQALNEAEETVVTATQIGYGPVDGGSMLSVTMPTYVAP